MNKIIVLTGSIVGCAYLTELFTAWYSGNMYEQYAFSNRALGPYWWSYWSMMTCNVISPQLFWIKQLRRNVWFTFFMSVIINVGMWFERFVIIVTSVHRDYIPSAWSYYSPTWVEISFFLGTLGLFLTLFLIFAKTLPVIAMAETKHILKVSGDSQKAAAAHAHEHHHAASMAFQANKP